MSRHDRLERKIGAGRTKIATPGAAAPDGTTPGPGPAGNGVADHWRAATVACVEQAATDMIAIGVRPERSVPHRAGQYCEVRFPGEELSRTYSIASSPSDPELLEFGIQLLPTGIFSPRLAGCSAGDHLEIRGPLGQAFLWAPEHGDTLVLFGAGAGITPLTSMYHHFVESYPTGTVLFHVSSKSAERVFRYDRYRDVLAPRFTGGAAGRINFDYIRGFLAPVESRKAQTNVRVCGPGAFIKTVVDAVLELGFSEDRVRAEGFA